MDINIDHVMSKSISALPGISRLAKLTKGPLAYQEVSRLAYELEKELTSVLESELDGNGKQALEMILRNTRLLYKLK